MKSFSSLLASACCVLAFSRNASASVFMPYTSSAAASSSLAIRSLSSTTTPSSSTISHLRQLRLALNRRNMSHNNGVSSAAMAIPGYGVAEQVFVGGFGNFLGIYNLIITGRILLSWFPQAQSIGALQPVYAITDPYLNLFRGLLPPLFGLDFSPILAFFLLSVLQNATVAVGAELTPAMKQQLPVFGAKSSSSKRSGYQMPKAQHL